MVDPSFRTVTTFTLVYGLVVLVLLGMQPLGGTTQTADAAGNFEAPFGAWLGIRVAAAE